MQYKSKYTSSQRSAYNSGKGYAVGHKKRGINFSKPELKKAFAEGYKKGVQMMTKNPLKYPLLPKKRKTTKKSK